MAAEAEGHRSAGTWLAAAADAYLKARVRAGAPIPLAWHRGTFRLALEDGSAPTLRGIISAPFGIFRGTAAGPRRSTETYTLAYLPSARILATLHTQAHGKSLAATLAGGWVRWDGTGGREPPGQDSGPVVDRFRREDA
jgi:hypothetical protein